MRMKPRNLQRRMFSKAWTMHNPKAGGTPAGGIGDCGAAVATGYLRSPIFYFLYGQKNQFAIEGK